MKTIQPNPHCPSQRGSVLVLTLVVTGLIGMVLVSYLAAIQVQNRSTYRSKVWNECIPLLESGIEESLAHINQNVGRFHNDNWVAVDYPGSTATSYEKWRDHNGNRCWTSISNVQPPIIFVRGWVPTPLGSRNGSTSYVHRTVRVTTTNNPLWSKGMVAKGQIDMNGNQILTDSFDSTDSTYSTNGRYDSSKRKSNGDVATNSGLTNSLLAGNANIYGKVATGPGGSISLGSGGAVGDAAWHAGNNNGIQPGYSANDMNVTFKDVLPPFSGTGLAPTSNLMVGSETYTHALGSGNYSMSSLSYSGQQKMIVTGDAVLYVTGNVSISGNAQIVLATNATLRLYVSGSTTSIGGNGVVNSGKALNFSYYGLPSNTSVSLHGNAAFTGTIYAPQAVLGLGGGGADNYDFVGASITETVRVNGHFKFHYDEALGKLGPTTGYLMSSWNEL